MDSSSTNSSTAADSKKQYQFTNKETITHQNADRRDDDDDKPYDRLSTIKEKESRGDRTEHDASKPRILSVNHQPKSPNPKTKIKCRHCGGNHFTIKCPLRSPDMRPRTWEQSNQSFDEKQRQMPFHCRIPLHPGKEAYVHAETVHEFWDDIRVACQHSLYRDFRGIVDVEKSGPLLLPDESSVPPGQYTFFGRTHTMTNKSLYELLDDAREALRSNRPISQESIELVQSELYLRFNHFSLRHEGNALGLDETKAITDLLARVDPKHVEEADELPKKMSEVSGTDHDILEAINHIQVSQELGEMARSKITETTILRLHNKVMDGLLTITEEGLPGEYRKVSIGVEGDSLPRPVPADVPPMMKKWISKLDTRGKNEHILDFLARIHSEFQAIHPFRDGNGRIGRLVMNLLLIQNGYPILTFPATLSCMFNQGVYTGIRENYTIFSRLLAESLHSSFQAYETGLGTKLLPDVDAPAFPAAGSQHVLVTP